MNQYNKFKTKLYQSIERKKPSQYTQIMLAVIGMSVCAFLLGFLTSSFIAIK